MGELTLSLNNIVLVSDIQMVHLKVIPDSVNPIVKIGFLVIILIQ